MDLNEINLRVVKHVGFYDWCCEYEANSARDREKVRAIARVLNQMLLDLTKDEIFKEFGHYGVKKSWTKEKTFYFLVEVLEREIENGVFGPNNPAEFEHWVEEKKREAEAQMFAGSFI